MAAVTVAVGAGTAAGVAVVEAEDAVAMAAPALPGTAAAAAAAAITTAGITRLMAVVRVDTVERADMVAQADQEGTANPSLLLLRPATAAGTADTVKHHYRCQSRLTAEGATARPLLAGMAEIRTVAGVLEAPVRAGMAVPEEGTVAAGAIPTHMVLAQAEELILLLPLLAVMPRHRRPGIPTLLHRHRTRMRAEDRRRRVPETTTTAMARTAELEAQAEVTHMAGTRTAANRPEVDMEEVEAGHILGSSLVYNTSFV